MPMLASLTSNFTMNHGDELFDIYHNTNYKTRMETEKIKYPVVYHPRYKLGTSWLKHLHKLDMDKSGDLFRALQNKKLITNDNIYTPQKVSLTQLGSVHSQDYIEKKLKDKNWLSNVFQVEAIGKVPYAITNHLLVKPILYHAGGTILAGELAAEKGWAINLGGGAHHAHANDASGFCMVADITMSITQLRKRHKTMNNVMIIDLDAHQGNGHERDFLDDPSVYILDIFTHGKLPNGDMFYPDDTFVMDRINLPVKLHFNTRNDEYLQKLKHALAKAKSEFNPDIIYYVAGTDILEGDPLGLQSITKSGLIERDEIVFAFAKELSVPIVSVQAGGYQPNLGQIVADSIENLHHKFDLF